MDCHLFRPGQTNCFRPEVQYEALFCSAVLSCAFIVVAEPAASDVLLTDVTLVDVESGMLAKDHSVLIEESRIAAIGSSAAMPEGTPLLDGGGNYLATGLWDSPTLSCAYFDVIEAPEKGLYVFGKSAHSPLFEEPGRATQILLQGALSGTNALADFRGRLNHEAGNEDWRGRKYVTWASLRSARVELLAASRTFQSKRVKLPRSES